MSGIGDSVARAAGTADAAGRALPCAALVAEHARHSVATVMAVRRKDMMTASEGGEIVAAFCVTRVTARNHPHGTRVSRCARRMQEPEWRRCATRLFSYHWGPPTRRQPREDLCAPRSGVPC